MSNLILEDVVSLIREQVRLCGYSQKTVAFNLGISPQYLSNILRYKREPGAKILKPMGLKKETTYVKE